jgi:4-hydroxy-tetrahydrodipicolinate reductase
MTLPLFIFGLSGRMGQNIIKAKDDRFDIIGGSSSNTMDPGIDRAKVAIDFSMPECFMDNLDLSVTHKVPLVVGTTGLSRKNFESLQDASRYIPIVQAPNFSVGIALMMDLVVRASKVLESADADVYERHHAHKKDAPSGTALGLASAIMRGRGEDFDFSVHGQLYGAEPRRSGAIGFSISRLGSAPGDHKASFGWGQETLEISHNAHSPEIFARGALDAAYWVSTQSPGLYSMRDVLGLQD